MTRTLNFSPLTTQRFSAAASVIHVRFAGESFDLPLSSLDIGARSSDEQIRRAVATNLRVPLQRLAEHTIDRHLNGNLTIRPDAVFV
jgi:3-deoxy-D-arabino-heptulosonate 7-phosphate (DAHP) synthase